MTESEAAMLAEKLKIGQKEGVEYPCHLLYCGNCTMPIEVNFQNKFLWNQIHIFFSLSAILSMHLKFCTYYPEYEKCKKWLEKNLPVEFQKLGLNTPAAEGGEEEEKKRQKRGGKGMIKANKKKDEGDKTGKISLSRAPRGKKKSVTVIHGLLTFG